MVIGEQKIIGKCRLINLCRKMLVRQIALWSLNVVQMQQRHGFQENVVQVQARSKTFERSLYARNVAFSAEWRQRTSLKLSQCKRASSLKFRV